MQLFALDVPLSGEAKMNKQACLSVAGDVTAGGCSAAVMATTTNYCARE